MPKSTHPECVRAVTSKLIKSDGFAPVPGLVTTMLTLPCFATRLAGIGIVTWVEDTKVYVPRSVPAQVTVPPLMNPEPFRISVKAGLPTGTLAGESEVRVGRVLVHVRGIGAPPTAAATALRRTNIRAVAKAPPIRLCMGRSLSTTTCRHPNPWTHGASDSFWALGVVMNQLETPPRAWDERAECKN